MRRVTTAGVVLLLLLAACKRADSEPPDAAAGSHGPAAPPALATVREQVDFPLLLPDDLAWLRLARADVADGRVRLRYEGNGLYLRVEQGWDVAPDAATVAAWPPAAIGSVMVQGQPATWLAGSFARLNDPTSWRPGPLRLYWTTAEGTGYLLESDFYDLAQLRQLAETVAPCTVGGADPERLYVRPRRPNC